MQKVTLLVIIFLMTMAVFIGLNQYVGVPIDCLETSSMLRIPAGYIQQFCWVHSKPAVYINYDYQAGMQPANKVPEGGFKFYQWTDVIMIVQVRKVYSYM